MAQEAKTNLGSDLSTFSGSFASGYLGDPDTVARLVAAYCTEVEQLLYLHSDGKLSPDEFLQEIRALTLKTADIFSGRDPAYQIIKGYHNATLKYKLMADLGEFWQSRRAAWNEDPVCVLFERLGLVLREKLKLAQGDDMLLDIMLKPSVQYTVQVLLGIEERQKPV